MFDYDRYHGFARLMVFFVSLIACWPFALVEQWACGYGFGGIWVRVKQEAAIARGMSKSEVMKRYKL